VLILSNSLSLLIWNSCKSTIERYDYHSRLYRFLGCITDNASVTEGFMRQIKVNSDKFNFIERGSMEIEGKGKMTTYFLEEK